jgi:hypothetical protein
LAAIWIAAEDRDAVTTAAGEIERVLADAPLSSGESRETNLRIFFVPPLGVRYLVEPDDLEVVIVQFWTF